MESWKRYQQDETVVTGEIGSTGEGVVVTLIRNKKLKRGPLTRLKSVFGHFPFNHSLPIDITLKPLADEDVAVRVLVSRR